MNSPSLSFLQPLTKPNTEMQTLMQDEPKKVDVTNDVMQKIFLYLTSRYDHGKCKLVSHRWNALATSNIVLRPLLEKEKATLPIQEISEGYFHKLEQFNYKVFCSFKRKPEDSLLNELVGTKKKTSMLSFLRANKEFLSQLHLLIVSPFSNSESEDLLESFTFISDHCSNLEVADLRHCDNINPLVTIVSIPLLKHCCPKLYKMERSYPQPAEKKVFDHFFPESNKSSRQKFEFIL